MKIPEAGENLVKHSITEAENGSVGDAKLLLKYVLDSVRQDKPLKEPLKTYFERAIQSIIIGVDARKALFLVKRQGAMSVKSKYEGPRDVNYRIARAYRDLKNSREPEIERKKKIREGFGLSIRQAQEIHQQFKELLDIEDGLI